MAATTSSRCARPSRLTLSRSSCARLTTRRVLPLTYEDIAAFVADVPDDVMIIVDEAYIDFATKPGVRTAVPLIETHPNVVVMRTFSKAHALAGVRVGYAIGDAEVIGAIQSLLVPFGVNSPCARLRPGLARRRRGCSARGCRHRR